MLQMLDSAWAGSCHLWGVKMSVAEFLSSVFPFLQQPGDFRTGFRRSTKKWDCC